MNSGREDASPAWHKALQQLIEAKVVEREVRGIHDQTRMARFPHHKDFATFDYAVLAMNKATLTPLITG